ncbi:UNVERIFIED_CONTAM: hypothetical protein GTU68_002716 [Idotea baltica]|nr:hypothetical protein [Idotea baltica]
MLPVALR